MCLQCSNVEGGETTSQFDNILDRKKIALLAIFVHAYIVYYVYRLQCI